MGAVDVFVARPHQPGTPERDQGIGIDADVQHRLQAGRAAHIRTSWHRCWWPAQRQQLILELK